jgi:hypothetical protein
MELTTRMMFRLTVLAGALLAVILFLGGCACDHPGQYMADERECDGMPNVDGTEEPSPPPPNAYGKNQTPMPGKSQLPPKMMEDGGHDAQ